MEQLSEDFESKVRSMEVSHSGPHLPFIGWVWLAVTMLQEEQHSLKQQLATLAISLNMEAQKRRHQEMDDHQHKTHSSLKQMQVHQNSTNVLHHIPSSSSSTDLPPSHTHTHTHCHRRTTPELT